MAGMLTRPQVTRPRPKPEQYFQGQAKATALKAEAEAKTICIADFNKCFLNLKLTLRYFMNFLISGLSCVAIKHKNIYICINIQHNQNIIFADHWAKVSNMLTHRKHQILLCENIKKNVS